MGTKLNPGSFDCYGEAKNDEPMFVLLGRDPLASMLVLLWCAMHAIRHFGLKRAKREEARKVATELWDYGEEQGRIPNWFFFALLIPLGYVTFKFPVASSVFWLLAFVI